MVENTESEKRKLIGEKIRKARAWANLKQEDLGRALNLPGNVISRMEMGERAVRVSELEIIAKITKQPMNFFYEEEKPEVEPDKYIDVSGLDDKEIEIIKATIDKIREVKKEKSA